jgi:hypothetical protein
MGIEIVLSLVAFFAMVASWIVLPTSKVEREIAPAAVTAPSKA